MEPKSGLEVAISPEFLLIMPIAVIIDIIGIVLLFFALDDFWITDVIAWVFIGGWGFIRSQVVPTPKPTAMYEKGYGDTKKRIELKEKMAKYDTAARVAAKKAEEAARAAEAAKKAGDMEKLAQETKRVQKFSRAARMAKNLKWLEFIPYVGALPLWSISVYMTIKYS